MTNNDRAIHAFYALQCYQSKKGEGMDLADRSEHIVDLITDLFHLVFMDHGKDPEEIVKTALLHFESEIK